MITPLKSTIILAAASLFLLPSCSSTAGKTGTTATQTAQVAPKSGKTLTVDKSLQEAHKSALQALTKLDCEIKADTATYVAGFRRRHIGVLVGSGGETLKIWLEEISATQSRVTVSTSKSLLGIAGQKNWDDEVAALIAAK